MQTTRKLGANRGSARLWIEGQFLKDAGFAHGTRWTVAALGHDLRITIDQDGSRKIAGTPDRPIIDINNAALLSGLGSTGDTVTLERVRTGIIEVRRMV